MRWLIQLSRANLDLFGIALKSKKNTEFLSEEGLQLLEGAPKP